MVQVGIKAWESGVLDGFIVIFWIIIGIIFCSMRSYIYQEVVTEWKIIL